MSSRRNIFGKNKLRKLEVLNKMDKNEERKLALFDCVNFLDIGAECDYKRFKNPKAYRLCKKIYKLSNKLSVIMAKEIK